MEFSLKFKAVSKRGFLYGAVVGILACMLGWVLEESAAARVGSPSIPRFSADSPQVSVGVIKFCSAANGSPGYMPQCDKIDTSSCTVTALGTGKEKSPDSNGDCTAGQLKVQRFNASAERETVCLDVSACGSNVALCQRWVTRDKTVRYSCVTNSAIQLGL